MRGKRSSWMPAVLVATGLLVTAASAGATVTPSRDANAVAAAIPAAGMSIGAASFLSIPPGGNPAGVGDTPIAPFPADGPTYAVLSTGDATQADQPDQAGSSPPRRRRDDAAHRARRQRARHDGPRDPDQRPGRRQLPVVRLPLPLRGVPGLRRLAVQRRLHRRARLLDLGLVGAGDHRPRERLRARRNGRSADRPLGSGRTVGARRGRDAIRRRERTAARQDGGDARSAHRLPVDLRSTTTSRHGRLRRRAADQQRVVGDMRARLAGRRAGARDHRARPRFHVADALPDAHRHGRRTRRATPRP